MSQAFDAAAATAAYLATVSPAAHAKAQAYTQGGYWLLLWGTVIGVGGAWLVLRSGVLARLGAGLQRSRPRPWLTAFLVFLVYSLMEFVIGLPWNIYANWWREMQYGQSSQAFGGWFGEQILGLAISTVLFGLVVTLLYGLMRRAPRTWWIWGGGVSMVGILVLMILAPVFIQPLFNDFKPAPPGPMRDTVVAMAEANGVPHDKILIYDGSKQSNRYTANVSGLFGTARIAMSDTMFKQGADIAEVKAVVGHEMGHYVHGHLLWRAVPLALIAMLAFFLVDRLFPVVARLVGAGNLKGISDPAAFPILAMIFAVLGLLVTPITNSVTRLAEADADTFSLKRFNEPDGMARALVKTIDYRAATPSALEEALFYSHPSGGSRVRKAMEWKAKHPPTVAP
jgi:STE24 endopeptidase